VGLGKLLLCGARQQTCAGTVITCDWCEGVLIAVASRPFYKGTMADVWQMLLGAKWDLWEYKGY
jgi:hypothetical protein